MSLTVTTRNDREIVLSRAFNAPRALVFDAWTKPELLTRWYGARGWRLVGCEVDLRVGGAWRFVSCGPGDDTMVQSGVYQEIAAPDRLVYTEKFDNQSYPGETLITHVFVERHDKPAATLLTSTLRYPSRDARDIVLRYPMARGVGEGLDRLAELLANLGETT
jgi:uncharacterized protein YndB with AHSA1/START domain